MLVKFTQSVGLLMLLAMGGCQTVEMSAKSGTDTVSAQGGTCARFKNERGSCNDQVGCSWDNSQGTCASH